MAGRIWPGITEEDKTRRSMMIAMAEELDWRREDDARAAGELLVPIPEPGTDMARVMAANRLLKGAIGADKERLRAAEARVWAGGKTWGCDAPEALADEIDRLLDVLRERHAEEDALSEKVDRLRGSLGLVHDELKKSSGTVLLFRDLLSSAELDVDKLRQTIAACKAAAT